MPLLKILFSAAILSVGFVSVAQAQPDSLDMFIRIDGQDSIDSGLLDSIIVLAPGTYTADIFLRETVGGGTPYLGSLTNSNGLTSSGINYLISGAGSSAASPDTPFNIESSVATTSTSGLVGGSNIPFGAAPPGTGRTGSAGVFQSFAGTFQFTFGGPSATINFSDPGGSNTSVFLDNSAVSSQVLDSFISFRGAMISSAAVPEPSSLMLLGVGVVSLASRRRRRVLAVTV